jgi:hypothetical protein
MAARRSAALNVNLSSAAEEQWAKFARGLTPWIVWLIGEPVAAAAASGLAKGTGYGTLVAWLLACSSLLLAHLTWRLTHSRGFGRVHHALNSLLGVGWVAAVTGLGWTAGHGLLLVLWFIVGLVMTLTWNLRYSQHSDGVEDVIGQHRQLRGKRVDVDYVIRVLAGRVPHIRMLAEKGGKVVPALASPWREPAPEPLEAAGSPKAITAGPSADHVDAAAAVRADQAAQAILKNFRDFTARKVTDLNGARIKLLDVKPWRIRTQVNLIRGVQIPKHLTDYREHMASQMALPASSVIIRPDPLNHSRVFLDFVLENVLETVRHWPGPQAVGKSIADAPVRIGIYEDRMYEESWETAVTEDMSRRLGIPERNLSHIISEGMTGSGKSTVVRIVIADGATRLDVVDWAADPVKKFQTLGCVAGALDWFAPDVAESKAMVRFLARYVIPERANYLGMHGYDNWEPGCGLPFLRVTIEEGGIIANELDDLDKVLNSARSAGVKIRASFQRAQHQVVDPNVRAAFGESLSFGVKDMGDVFVLPDELLHAGADPSMWQDRQPGMHYRSAAGIDFQRQLMAPRSFQVDREFCSETVAEYAPARDAWIAENCPDWAEMLSRLDANGVYANRTTGAAVLEKMAAADRRKAARSTPKAAPAVDVEPEDDEPLAEVRDLPRRGPERMKDEDEIFVAELVDDGEDPPVTFDELDIDDADLMAGLGEDDDIDPRKPIPPGDPDVDALDFSRPARPQVSRDDALAALRHLLAELGPGREFRPRDIYERACAATGKSPAWIRGELSTTLAIEGLVENDRLEGIYTVTERVAA